MIWFVCPTIFSQSLIKFSLSFLLRLFPSSCFKNLRPLKENLDSRVIGSDSVSLQTTHASIPSLTSTVLPDVATLDTPVTGNPLASFPSEVPLKQHILFSLLGFQFIQKNAFHTASTSPPPCLPQVYPHTNYQAMTF